MKFSTRALLSLGHKPVILQQPSRLVWLSSLLLILWFKESLARPQAVEVSGSHRNSRAPPLLLKSPTSRLCSSRTSQPLIRRCSHTRRNHCFVRKSSHPPRQSRMCRHPSHKDPQCLRLPFRPAGPLRRRRRERRNRLLHHLQCHPLDCPLHLLLLDRFIRRKEVTPTPPLFVHFHLLQACSSFAASGSRRSSEPARQIPTSME